ncbi:MAG: hypothetical protein WC766_03245 [Patescibacteria group bacterium]|jgi:hypothetical protein
MKLATILGGPLGSGVYTDLNPSEGAAITNTAASAVRSIVKVGLIAVGALLLLSLFGGVSDSSHSSEPSRPPNPDPPNPPPPPPPPPPPSPKPNPADVADLQSKLTRDPVGPSLSGFALAKTRHREIFGVCLDEWIDVYCEDQLASIPIAFIHEIKFVKQVGGVVLIDGSRLANVRFIRPYLSFCTLAGLQTVNLNHYHVRFADGQLIGSRNPELGQLELDQLLYRRLQQDPSRNAETLADFTKYEKNELPVMGGHAAFVSYTKPYAKHQQEINEIDFEYCTETRLLRGVLPVEAEQIRKRLLNFLQTEEVAVKKALGYERYQEYLKAALGKPRIKEPPKLLTDGTGTQKTIYPIPAFEWRPKGVLEIILRGCDGYDTDTSGRATLGINLTDRAKTSRVLFEGGELDLNRGVIIGDYWDSRVILPRQNNLARGTLKREGSQVLFEMHDAHPCCIYKNGLPIDLDSQTKKAGAIVFGRNDILEIGEAYALRWHNYYG